MHEPISLTERAYVDIKRKVISGAYSPGAHFEAGQLSDDLGMSRTPVREALLRLQNEGVLEIVAKKGIRIVPLSATDLHDVYQIITGLEIEAVGNLAAQAPSDVTLATLNKATSAMNSSLDDQGADNQEVDGWSLADENFHREIFNLCGNTRLCVEGHRHRDLAQRAHFVAMRMIEPEQKRRSIRSHIDLVELIKSGDEAKVRRVHFEQRVRGAELLVNIVKKHGLKLL